MHRVRFGEPMLGGHPARQHPDHTIYLNEVTSREEQECFGQTAARVCLEPALQAQNMPEKGGTAEKRQDDRRGDDVVVLN